MLENIPSPEISKDEVINTFKQRGIEDVEAQAFYNKWYTFEQEKLERANTLQALIDFNIALADIYEAIEDYSEAFKILDDVLDAVTSLGDLDLFNIIATRLQDLNDKF